MHPEGTSRKASWPYLEGKSLDMTFSGSFSCLYLMADSLFSHCQCLASTKAVKRSWSHEFLQVVNSLSLSLSISLYIYHLASWFCGELLKKAQKANNLWWRLSGLLRDQNCMFMYIVFQALFTLSTMMDNSCHMNCMWFSKYWRFLHLYGMVELSARSNA